MDEKSIQVGKRIFDEDRRHVFHSWSAQAQIKPLAVAGGLGSWFWDCDGNRYLDFSSQLVNMNLGHQHPRLVKALQDQAAEMSYIGPPFAVEPRSTAARMIAERAPGDLNSVFFTNGGADANEHAVRMARLVTGRQKILSAYRSYHGATTGAITLTGDPRRWLNEPGTPGSVRFFGPYAYRSAFGATDSADECRLALTHLEQVIELEGPHTIAGLVLETVVGTNGVLVPPDGYLAGVRALCDKHGIALIFDEVMVGFGRLGEWFACNAWGVTPDLITFAKGVNSGYVPLGGVIISDAIAQHFADRPFPGGLTYSGHPIACAVAVEHIKVIEDEGILENVRRAESWLAEELPKLMERHPSVGEIRGKGLLWAIELVRNRDTHEALVPFNATGVANEPMARVVEAIRKQGVWPFQHFNRLHLCPPLNISEEDLSLGLAAYDEALYLADEYVTS